MSEVYLSLKEISDYLDYLEYNLKDNLVGDLIIPNIEDLTNSFIGNASNKWSKGYAKDAYGTLHGNACKTMRLKDNISISIAGAAEADAVQFNGNGNTIQFNIKKLNSVNSSGTSYFNSEIPTSDLVLNGNATTTKKLNTPIQIKFTGDVQGEASFDGTTQNIPVHLDVVKKFPTPSNSIPLASSGSGSAGSNTTEYSRHDHFHPIQTSVSGKSATASLSTSAGSLARTSKFKLSGGLTAANVNYNGTQASITLNATAVNPLRLFGTAKFNITGSSATCDTADSSTFADILDHTVKIKAGTNITGSDVTFNTKALNTFTVSSITASAITGTANAGVNINGNSATANKFTQYVKFGFSGDIIGEKEFNGTGTLKITAYPKYATDSVKGIARFGTAQEIKDRTQGLLVSPKTMSSLQGKDREYKFSEWVPYVAAFTAPSDGLLMWRCPSKGNTVTINGTDFRRQDENSKHSAYNTMFVIPIAKGTKVAGNLGSGNIVLTDHINELPAALKQEVQNNSNNHSYYWLDRGYTGLTGTFSPYVTSDEAYTHFVICV